MCDRTNVQNDLIISDLTENLLQCFWPSFKNLTNVRTHSLQKKMNNVEGDHLLSYFAE